ncbi:MAG: acetyl-CoA hydrolase/transferase C-terminal domain-containing protein [Pseudomonadota bacterium]
MRTFAQVIDSLSPGARVFVAGCGGEPSGFANALAADPSRAPGLVFTGAPIPGVNTIDWSALSAGGLFETILLSPALREGFAAGRVRFLPLHYTALARRLGARGHVDVAVVRVAPAEGDTFSLGLTTDFAPLVIDAGARLIGEVDRTLPAPRGAPTLPRARFDALVETDRPAPLYDPGEVPDAIAKAGQRVADLVPEGASLQFGLSKVQVAVLEALQGRKGLSYHGGMISDALEPLVEDGAFKGPLTTGVAIGSARHGAWVAERDDILFRPVTITHGTASLAGVERMTAINSVLAVDLFGQAVADMVDGRQVSGHGGLLDFVRGTQVSPGGRSILALAASAKGGTISRIVPCLDGAAVTVPRGDQDIVVTEHGAAHVKDLDIDERAEALISIAAPSHRDRLTEAWRQMRARM